MLGRNSYLFSLCALSVLCAGSSVAQTSAIPCYDGNSRIITSSAVPVVTGYDAPPMLVNLHDVAKDPIRLENVGSDTYTLDSIATLPALVGSGIVAQTTITAENPDPNTPIPGTYVGHAGGVVNIPIRFAAPALPANADVHRLTFRVTFPTDLFSLLNNGTNAFQPGNDYIGRITSGPTIIPGEIDSQYVTVDVTSTLGQITSLDLIGVLYLQLFVSPDTVGRIIISDVRYYDSSDSEICCIQTDTISGTVVEIPLCHDQTIRNWLEHKPLFQNISIRPNPCAEFQPTILSFDINDPKVPVRLEIFNMLGSRVRTVDIAPSGTAGARSLPLDLQGLGRGVYMVHCSASTGSSSVELIVE